MDGHLMFPIYGTLIIVIIHRILIIFYMNKNNKSQVAKKLDVNFEISKNQDLEYQKS